MCTPVLPMEAEMRRASDDPVVYPFAHLTSASLDAMNLLAFKSLRPGCWVHSAVITAHVNRVLGDMLAALLRHTNTADVPPCHLHDVRVLESVETAALREGALRVWGYDSLRVQGSVDPLTRFETAALVHAKCVFLVQNSTDVFAGNSGEHWVVYLCSPKWETRTLRVYVLDSMLDDDGRHHSARDHVVREFFLTLYSNVAQAGTSRRAATAAPGDGDYAGWCVTAVRALSCPQQRNGHDCGVFAMTNIEHLVRHGNVALLMDEQQPPYTQADANALRVRWGQRILQRAVELRSLS